ncbi:putative mucin TcMUCII [Trypanosoma cruzi]|uniref:Mucin TcMUCII, putative n=2 Tax=Trypanosoma cruzi TaxID=5693 RepID=Q4E0A9_TRYCC|nr:mucin TcMUCII, putative [Trypanosoma cruzi]EAN98212.1 mucin TcMUCII, putative [Trypanosoma cruzi]PWV04875.1 putative mucin TcMUCII [Trypanosoma cruzi]RNC41421.1 mucin TcMUCII [Trypanosoma cruzi]|eukprot:XP_820063.1 mucin TcMUCII [Trypanosoma cruzi strain CL Brener]
MMTCRLLCALLVLALCCCPSVCVTAQDPDSPSSSPEGTGVARAEGGVGTGTGAEPEFVRKNEDGPRNKETTTPNTEAISVEVQTLNTEAGVAGQSGSVNTKGQDVEEIPGPLQKPDAASAREAVKKANTEIKPSNTTTTTTTTTQAPSTTITEAPNTTTTTTTTAPEAPSSTAMNVEAPTTTKTTRAPSLLREIDGSRSGSAWVCAPLLLAVSALAYTTLG